MSNSQEPFRVLIAGAGIGGLGTAVALARVSGIPNLDIQIYEQADELREIGASIALSPNGMRTLEKLGVHNALDDDVGFRGPSKIPQIFRHWKTNQVNSVDTYTNLTDSRHQTTRFHRGHLHAALLSHVPQSSIHLGKKTVNATADKDGVTLFFEDGTSAQGDLLIAADGLRSRVRQTFFPDHKLKFSGKIFMRSTFDASLVEGKVPDLPPDAIHWWGPKSTFFASRLGKGQYTTVGALDDLRTTEEIDGTVTWNQEEAVQVFRDKYKDWNPTVSTLAQLTPYIRLYPNYYGDELPTWVPADRVTLIGDAAHTHGGSFAAGGSLALDDAYALALSLKQVLLRPLNDNSKTSISSDGAEIREALTIYDSVRRPHTQKLLNVVHRLAGAAPTVYATPEEEEKALLARIKARTDTTWLSEHDVEATFAAVVEASKKPDQSGQVSSRL